MPETLQHASPSRLKTFFVKLEYRVEAPDEEAAVDALVAAIRHAATRDVWVTRTAELLRTDVRLRGEVWNW